MFSLLTALSLVRKGRSVGKDKETEEEKDKRTGKKRNKGNIKFHSQPRDRVVHSFK